MADYINCPYCEVRRFDADRFTHCYWCHRIRTEDFWDVLSDYLEQDPDRTGKSMFEAAERMVAVGLIEEPIDTVNRPQREPPAPPPTLADLKAWWGRWWKSVILVIVVLGVLMLVCSVATAPELATPVAPTAIPAVTPEAPAADFGAMAWPDVVKLYEKNQGDNPTSLYTDALMSLKQGDITGVEVLATVEGSSSFTTYCAMSMAWLHSGVGGYEDSVLDRMAVLLVSRWPAQGWARLRR